MIYGKPMNARLLTRGRIKRRFFQNPSSEESMFQTRCALIVFSLMCLHTRILIVVFTGSQKFSVHKHVKILFIQNSIFLKLFIFRQWKHIIT